MTRVLNFVADLARAGKDFLEIKKNSGHGLWGQGIEEEGKNTDDKCHLNLKKTVRTPASLPMSPPPLRKIVASVSKLLLLPIGYLFIPFTASFTRIWDLERSPPDGSRSF
jgi:hypothetical protein